MKKIIYNILCVLFALLLINGGLNKFLNYMPVPDDLEQGLLNDYKAILEISWLMPLIGAAEILGGLLILLPRTRALGALVIFPVMVGVLLTHIFVAPSGLIIALVIWIILLWIIYENWHRYLPIIKK